MPLLPLKLKATPEECGGSTSNKILERTTRQSGMPPAFLRLRAIEFVNLGRRKCALLPSLGWARQPGICSPSRAARMPSGSWGMPANANEADAILVFGGDGTVHRHLPQLVRLRLPVLVVPHGSGNDFARALQLRSVDDALSAWRQFVSGRGSVRQVDLGSSPFVPPDAGGAPAPHGPGAGRYFGCVGGVGLDVEVARRANRLPRALRRRGGYLFSLLPALSGFHPVGVRVQASLGEAPLSSRYAGPAMLVAFANTSHLWRRHQDRAGRPARRWEAGSLYG